MLRKYNIPCDQLANNTVVSHCEYLSEIMTELKMLNRLPYDFEERLSATFIPSRGEYQNFGIMAAIDHINALKDLVKCFPKFADLPKIYGGGVLWRILSLAHSKNSSLVCGLNYIIGRELEFKSKDTNGDMYMQGDHFFVSCFLKTHWTRKENSPYFFNNENYFIRTLLNKDHLILQSQKNKNII